MTSIARLPLPSGAAHARWVWGYNGSARARVRVCLLYEGRSCRDSAPLHEKRGAADEAGPSEARPDLWAHGIQEDRCSILYWSRGEIAMALSRGLSRLEGDHVGSELRKL